MDAHLLATKWLRGVFIHNTYRGENVQILFFQMAVKWLLLVSRRNTSTTYCHHVQYVRAQEVRAEHKSTLGLSPLWCSSYFNQGTNDEIKYEKQRRGEQDELVRLPDQILGFDSWGLDATADDARASDVNPPGKKTTMIGAGTTQSFQVMQKAFSVIVM